MSGLAIVIGLCLVPSLWAGSKEYEEGRKLFEQRDYIGAQTQLRLVRRADLSQAEVGELDRMIEQLRTAVPGAEQAIADKKAADRAYDAGRFDEADKLYLQVVNNSFAPPALWDAATARRSQISQTRAGGSGAAAPAQPARTGGGGAVQMQMVEPGDKPQPIFVDVEPEQTGPLTVVDEIRQREHLLWQRAVAKLNEAVRLAGEAVAEGRFEDARQLADGALQLIEANRAYAEPVTKYDAAHEMALNLKKTVQDEYEKYQIASASEAQIEIARRVAEAQARQEQLRTEKVEQLFNTASQLAREQRFSEARETIRQIRIIDPGNPKATYFLEVYDDLASLLLQSEIDRDYRIQTRGTFEAAKEALIPWNADILYPRNWPEISARRDRQGDLGLSDDDSELNRRLEDLQTEINFEEQPFEQVVDFLTDLNKINIHVDWEDLEARGVERDKPVSISLREVKLSTVLNEILSQVGGDVVLGYNVGDGLLRIATKEKLDREKFILVYDIRDLIVDIPRFTDAPKVGLGSGGTGQGSGMGGLGNTVGSGSIFAGSQGGQSSTREEEGEDASREIVQRIMDIVRQTVEPDSWQETGGGNGALRELNGQLIIYNTSDAHQQVTGLLKQLRRSRALMIAVESRFLIVGSNFLEEIGVDLDFVFNAGSAAYDPAFNNTGAPLRDPFTGANILIPRNFSQAGVLPAVPAFGQPIAQITPAQPYGNAALVPTGTGVIPQFNNTTPIGVSSSSIDLANPGTLNTGISNSFGGSSFAPALSLAGSFLDNLQVDFLVRATQANKRSSIVQAPRLMLFNGQRAWVAVTRQRQYVGSVTANVAEGAVGIQPVINTASSGSTLDVEGTISADRKYVTLTIETGLGTEPSFEDFFVQRPSGNSPGIFIRLVDQELREIKTTVSVPDGGTVLLGGLKQVGEIEVEAGVPLLSKIPILKRAFTNTSRIKDTQTLLILLKAKILIQEEAEEEAFPMLRSAGA